MKEILDVQRKCKIGPNGETRTTIDLDDPHIWWNAFLVQAGFMEIVSSAYIVGYPNKEIQNFK